MRIFRISLLFCLFLKLSACATQPDPIDDNVVVEERTVTTASETPGKTARVRGEKLPEQTTDESVSGHPAVVALLDESQRNLTAGKKESAIAALERGIRLQPKNPLLWHRLAIVRSEQQNWQQVIALAQKSISLAAGNIALQRANWKMIETARRVLGDTKGMRRAQREVERLR